MSATDVVGVGLRGAALLSGLALGACFPTLPDRLAEAGGVPDATLDVADPDVDPLDPPPDMGPAPDAALDARPPDAACAPRPSACNRSDDDCDGRVDEGSEALEGCVAIQGAVPLCVLGACEYRCMTGATPIGASIEEGCRRGCAIDAAGWVTVATGFSDSDDDAQQVTLAGRGARRFVAAYDLRAEGAEPVVRSFIFDQTAPADADEQRLGDPREANPGVLVGLTSAAVGERFVLAAWRRVAVDAEDQVQLIARGDDGVRVRGMWVDWPQPPAIAARPGEAPALLTFVESHVERADPPLGELVVDAWDGAGADAELWPPPLTGETRPAGPLQNAAAVLANGDAVLVGDVTTGDDPPAHALRVDRFDPALTLAGSTSAAIDGPLVDRITVARGAGGLVILTALGETGVLEWRTLSADGSQLLDGVVVAPWQATPDDSQALALPGGVGAIYRAGGRLHLTLPDPARPDRAFDGSLPGAPANVRAAAAFQPDPSTVEIAILREAAAGEARILYGRHVCY